jgi:diaminopimelate decarboxylase
LPFEELNLGGGFGIKHTEAEDPPEIQDVLRSITATIKGLLWEYDLGHEPKLIFEPGRSIIGPAGVSLYRVGSRKQVPGGKYYLAVDGGMADNPRPTTYSADYSAELVGSNHGDKLEEYTIAGRYCESGDILIDAVHLPGDVKENDLLMIPATGGYCYAMASNYNRSLRPAVVLVSQGEAEVIRERESLEAMLRGDLLPTRLEAELV